jgi:hypothetical protein
MGDDDPRFCRLWLHGLPPQEQRFGLPGAKVFRPSPTTGASIIVSDEPLSRETNYRTEFVAVLNNQPQGGFLTRQPTADVAVASGNFWGDDGLGSFFQPNWNPQTGNTRHRGGQPYYPAQRGYPAQQGYPVQQGYPMQPGRW